MHVPVGQSRSYMTVMAIVAGRTIANRDICCTCNVSKNYSALPDAVRQFMDMQNEIYVATLDFPN